ncbi:hypothetical protein [Pseudobacillus badius]|uniref:hypothetical protein n=1 Tax=Bacillus badius TaxID=1455 RepID=UPI0007B3BD35|nr:hypothetical protein [Bacillus badius]KZR57528.1 hypothetical protein A3781_19745 [Bacillus badius]
MTNFQQIKKVTFSMLDFKTDLTPVEKVGMVSIINDVLGATTGLSDTIKSLGGHFTSNWYRDSKHSILNIQDNHFYLEGDTHALSHFKLSTNHDILAVCYDDNGDEIVYILQ